MKSRRILHYLTLVIFIASFLASCDEKDDFILGPTPTSVTLYGKIRDYAGNPIKGIPAKVEYRENGIFGSNIRHKAKGETDSNGQFHYFFEPEEEQEPTMSQSQSFFLELDLKSIGKNGYMMPSDLFRFGDISHVIYQEYLYFHIREFFTPSSTIYLDLVIPRTKTITVHVKNNPSDKRLYVKDFFKYADSEGMVMSKLDYIAPGECVVSMKGIVGPNRLLISDVMPDEHGFIYDNLAIATKEVTITDTSDTYIVIDLADTENDSSEKVE